MKILITGAYGFIGRYLTKELKNAGHEVIEIGTLHGDLSLPDTASRLIIDIKPDIVVHLAARIGRLNCEEDAETTIRNNTLATTHVARACGDLGVRLVYFSTSEAAGDHGLQWVDESTPDKLPHNFYGLTKRWGEEVSLLYSPKGLQIIRPSMPYGPGMPAGPTFNALVTFLWCAYNNKPIIVHEGSARCWCWIEDTVRGIRMIIEDGGEGIWVVGRDDNEITMSEIAFKACELFDRHFLDLVQTITPKHSQTLVKRLLSSRLQSIGWEPKVDIDEGMSIIAGYIKNYDIYGRPE